MRQHTPGPWQIEIAHVGAETFTVAAANARLIAAAPDLLEALETLINAKALSIVEEVVAGWNGPADEPYKPHPRDLRATIQTTCGALYDLDAAIKAARSSIAKANGDA